MQRATETCLAGTTVYEVLLPNFSVSQSLSFLGNRAECFKIHFCSKIARKRREVLGQKRIRNDATQSSSESNHKQFPKIEAAKQRIAASAVRSVYPIEVGSSTQWRAEKARHDQHNRPQKRFLCSFFFRWKSLVAREIKERHKDGVISRYHRLCLKSLPQSPPSSSI